MRESLVRFSEAWVRLSAFSLLVFLPVLVSPWGVGPEAYSQPKALVLYALVGSMILGWLTGYLAARRPKWRVTLAEFPLWIFVAMVLLSTWTTVNARLTFLGAFGRKEGLVSVLAYVALFPVGVHSFGSKAGVTNLARTLGVVSLVVMVYGVLQIGLPPLFPGEAMIDQYYNALGERVFSTLGSPILYGAYLSVAIPLTAAMFLANRTGMPSWVWLGGTILATGSAILTMTRGAWLGIFLGGLVFAAGLGWSHLHLYRRRILALLACMAIAGILLLTTITGTGRAYQRVLSALDVETGSTAQHVYIWKQTVRLVTERPILGWGLETLGQVFPYNRQELVRIFSLRPSIIDRAHNDVLHVAVSIGIPGALAYVTFWILVLLSGARLVRRTDGEARVFAAGFLAGLVGYLVQAQVSFSSVAVTPMVWLLAGSLAGWEAAGDGR